MTPPDPGGSAHVYHTGGSFGLVAADMSLRDQTGQMSREAGPALGQGPSVEVGTCLPAEPGLGRVWRPLLSACLWARKQAVYNNTKGTGWARVKGLDTQDFWNPKRPSRGCRREPWQSPAPADSPRGRGWEGWVWEATGHGETVWRWESIPDCELQPDPQSPKGKNIPRKHVFRGGQELSPGLSTESQAAGQSPWTQKPKAQPLARASEQRLQLPTPSARLRGWVSCPSTF